MTNRKFNKELNFIVYEFLDEPDDTSYKILQGRVRELVKRRDAENKVPDHEGFGKHLKAMEDAGCPLSRTDLVEKAEMYNTPIPAYCVGIKKGNQIHLKNMGYSLAYVKD